MRYFLALAACTVLTTCGSSRPPGEDDGRGASAFRPIRDDVADLWDRQTTENAAFLRRTVEAFNADYDGVPVEIVQSGNYGDIYRKTTAAIRAGVLPAMVVAYGNMTVEYAKAGAVVDLDPYLNDPEVGLSQEDLGDFFPEVLEQNRYETQGGALLSFPYTKAVLVLYLNQNVLGAAGIDEPPATWSAFLDQCRRVKDKTGNYALAFDVDASTVNGMIFSRGGEIVQHGIPTYATPEARASFKLIETLFREDLAFQNPPRSFNDQTAFGNDEIAFAFRPSSSLPYFRLVMEGNDGWSVASIPQRDPAHKATVLYGANVSILDTTAAQKDASWAFLKYFTSPEVNAQWALQTGYLPIRKSAVDNPQLQAYWQRRRYNRVPFDCLAYARSEPNIEGWQTARALLDKAVTEVITGLKSADEALASLQLAIDAEAVFQR